VVHNSRRPLDRLTLTLTLTFDLIFIGGQGIVMDYPCDKFGNFSFSRFGFIVRTDRFTEADQRYTHATTVGVRKTAGASAFGALWHILVGRNLQAPQRFRSLAPSPSANSAYAFTVVTVKYLYTNVELNLPYHLNYV